MSLQPSLALGAGGVPYVAWREQVEGISPIGQYYRGPLAATRSGNSILSQAVTIPLTMTAPTLSFLYQTRGQFAPGASSFRVAVDEGVTSTTLFSTTTTATTWSHRWLDLAPWAGKGITVTFEAHQVAGLSSSAAYLDEVSLGSVYPDLWLRAQPAQGNPGQPLTLTISLGNRGPIAASSVRLTDTLPAGLSFVNANLVPLSTSPLVWDIGDLPAASGPVTLTIEVLAPDQVDLRRPLTNTASIAAATGEIETLNNTVQTQLDISHRIYLPVITASY